MSLLSFLAPCTEGWVGAGARLDALGERKILLEIEPTEYIDYTILAPCVYVTASSMFMCHPTHTIQIQERYTIMLKTQASGDGILFHRKFASPFQPGTTDIRLYVGEQGGTPSYFLHKDKQKGKPGQLPVISKLPWWMKQFHSTSVFAC
jgi:hypothetical protein